MRAARAFTLLESIAALVILAGVAVVCLQLRMQTLGAAQSVRQAAQSDRAIDALLHMAEAGLLPISERPQPDDPSRRIVHRGQRLGEPYEVVRQITLVPNAIPGAAARGLPVQVPVEQFTLTHLGRTVTILRPANR